MKEIKMLPICHKTRVLGLKVQHREDTDVKGRSLRVASTSTIRYISQGSII